MNVDAIKTTLAKSRIYRFGAYEFAFLVQFVCEAAEAIGDKWTDYRETVATLKDHDRKNFV
jgi:hypothetical protein